MPIRSILSAICLAFALVSPYPALAGSGPRFEALRQDGAVITEADLAGWRLYYFGYTMCPDICPTSLITLAETLQHLGPTGDRITPVFITVDAERDTPDVLREYVTAFHPRLLGLTPTETGLQSFATAYKVRYKRVEMPDGRPYGMDHTAVLMLIDPEGRAVGRYPHNWDPAKLADRIAATMAGAPPTQ